MGTGGGATGVGKEIDGADMEEDPRRGGRVGVKFDREGACGCNERRR